jgi:hypothetical protein
MSTKLGNVQILGPTIPGTNQRFWTVNARAARFDRMAALDSEGSKIGTVADHVHPLRSLSLFPPEQTGQQTWQRPGLMSANILLGSINSHYDNGRGQERLDVRLGKDTEWKVEYLCWLGRRRIKMQTIPEAGRNAEAPFVQIVVEPDGGDQLWPARPCILLPAIKIPALRIVAGRIPIDIRYRDLKPFHLLIKEQKNEKEMVPCWLTPAGIEVDALVPFPGTRNSLKARVEISPLSETELALTLIEPESPGDWLRAWQRLTPELSGEIALPCLRFRATDRNSVPELRWRTGLENGQVALPRVMEAPRESVAFSLRSPEEPGTAPEAQVSTDWVTITSSPGSQVTFAFGEDLKEPAIQLNFGAGHTILSCNSELQVENERLAEQLRTAYGLPDPVSPSVAGMARELASPLPLIPAFVPLEEGWLQLPIPNAPAGSIFETVSAASAQPNVLNGFFRVRGTSAEEAPWSLTVEGAAGASGKLVVTPGRSSATLENGCIAFGIPRLLTSGLFWVSDDRPDSEEALPRFGAGPGRFIPTILSGPKSSDAPLTASTSLTVEVGKDVAIAALDLDVTINTKHWGQSILETKQARVAFAKTRRIVEGAYWRPVPTGSNLEWLAWMIAAHRDGEHFIKDDWNQAKLLVPAGHEKLKEQLAAIVNAGRLTSVGLDQLLDSVLQAMAKDQAVEHPLPWPAVVWRRHGAIPLSATMPMTRAAAGSARPLESRELIPMLISRTANGTACSVARLKRREGQPLWTVDPATKAKRLPAWPWSDRATVEQFPSRGIAFAMLGVPGVELRPKDGETALTQVAYEGAIRFDLPAQDEAHATAGLPPVEDGSATTAEPAPAGTALDWDLLDQLFQEKERKHQIGRVAESYATAFRNAGPAAEVTVKHLVRGWDWTVNAGIDLTGPYGSLTLGANAVAGNDALRGFSGNVVLGGQPVTVLGNAPATFDAGHFILDNHQMGAQAPTPPPAQTISIRNVRHVQFVEGVATVIGGKLVTVPPVTVTLAGRTLEFFAKDVYVDASGVAVLPSQDLPFKVWDDDQQLIAYGLEWRLTPPDDVDSLKQGRCEIPFKGFRLEPLRLQNFALAANSSELSIVIRCRLSLGSASNLGDDGSIVDIALSGNAGRLTGHFETAPVAFTLEANSAGSFQRVAFSAQLQPNFTFAEPFLDVEYAANTFRMSAVLALNEDGTVVLTGEAPASDGKDGAWFGLTEATVTVNGGTSTIAITPGLEIRQSGATVFKWNKGVNAKLLGHDVGAPTLIDEPGNPAVGLRLVEQGYWLAFAGRLSGGKLAVGVFEGRIANFPIPVAGADVNVEIHVHCGKKSDSETETWSGTATLNGRIAANNAIRWPELTWVAPTMIPAPLQGGLPNSGRTKVSLGTGRRTHKVTWHLQNHQLPLGVAANIGLAGNIATTANSESWRTVVRAEHTVGVKDKEPLLKWSSIDVIAMGSPEVLIPRFSGYGQTQREVTFAGRYAESLENGQFTGIEQGMLWPGLGELARVLQGHLGEAFRSAFWKQPNVPKFIIVGGFIGLLGRSDKAPLLRVPVLVGTEELPQDALQDCQIAWADGPAAPEVAGRYANASVAPSNGEEAELWAAMKAVPGNRRLALPAEQFFVATPLPPCWNSPFFLSSAISLERVIRWQKGNPASARSVSLVAWESKGLRSSVALELESVPPGPVRRRRGAEFVVVGKQVTIETWRGPATTTADSQTLKGLMRARAGAVPVRPDLLESGSDVQPRAGILLIPKTNGASDVAVAVFAPTELTRPKATLRMRTHQDLGRGHLYSANAGNNGWQQPPIQGHSVPLRDDGSGIAGIATGASLPVQAAPNGMEKAVWLSHSKVPVYLPLELKGVVGPPIGWLTPAPPLVRLPVREEIESALIKAEADPQNVQPFLPGGIGNLEVASRSGILFAERFRLLSNLSNVPAYDRQFSRFGRPGQAGLSFARKLRTPRPGPLPENQDYPNDKANRRVQGSLVHPLNLPVSVHGSANIIQGGSGDNAWAITIVAGPPESRLDRNWNGTLDLVCTAEFGNGFAPPNPSELVHSKLLGANSRAWLQVGLRQICFVSVAVSENQADPEERQVRLTLKLQQPIDSHLSDFRDALQGTGPLPEITLHWMVTPRKESLKESMLLSIPSADPIGNPDGPPVTLTFPLYAVNPDRGSLPLVPTTLLFMDPAYNRDLSSIPHVDSRKFQLDQSLVLPNGRGELQGRLMADASKVDRTGSLTLLYDVRFEKSMSELEQEKVKGDVLPGGDLRSEGVQPEIDLTIKLLKKEGGLPISFCPLRVTIGLVYQVQLTSLVVKEGQDKNKVSFASGDVLQISSSSLADAEVSLYGVSLSIPANQIGRTLQVRIIDGPAFEPPPARYDVFMTLNGRVSAPLQAQSPLPARVEIVDAALGFRRGMIERIATFVWTLLRPRSDQESMTLDVVKGDRNGQTSIP